MFKVGDRVRCVDNSGVEKYLTVGIMYNVIGFDEERIYVNDDLGTDFKFKHYRFELETGSNVIHPSHYNQGKIECWDYIVDHNMGFLAGNVVKYVTRYADKNGMEDLKKAKEYLDKLIEVEESNDGR